MKNLIIYGTKHGCAKRCAELLSERLEGETDIVDIKEKSNIDLLDYDSIIIGGSIYAGKINKDIYSFTTTNENLLHKKKLGLFICSMNKSLEDKQIKESFPSSLLESARVAENFGGEFRLNEMNFMEKIIVKMVSKSLEKEGAESSVSMKDDIDKVSIDTIKDFADAMNKS